MREAWIGGVVSGAAALLTCVSFARDVDPLTTGDLPAWVTVWHDDFDGHALDSAKWKPEESCWGGGNNERQCYTAREANITVGDSVLRLIAKRERFTGPLYPEEMNDVGEKKFQWYTSGKIRTRGIADWQYGRISARMKLPQGQGTWPAFWMMPSADNYGPWPLSGEIDIMEAVNLNTPCEDCALGVETRTSGALHFGDLAPKNTYLFSKAVEKQQGVAWEDWNVYTVEWAAGTIQWFVNDEIFMRISADDWHTAAADKDAAPFAPFDQPFYLMINLAVGGNLAEKSNGGGFVKSSFPAELLVDWVKVEQCSNDITGRACLSDQQWDGVPQGPWETMAR